MNTIKSWHILVGVILIASFLRLYQLNMHPAGFFNDEVSFFYNALVLKHTGMDEDGRSWPIYLNSYIDPKPALISYLQIGMTYIAGETIWAARMVGAMFGIVSIGLVYVLMWQLTEDKKLSLLISALMAISPWHIITSRGTQEVIVSFTFGLAALVLLIAAYKAAGLKRWIAVAVYFLCLLLSMYSYHSAKIVMPLLSLLTVFRFASLKKSSWWMYTGVILSSIVGLWLTVFVASGSLDRLDSVSIFADGGPQLVLDEQIRVATGQLPQVVMRAFHNKIVNYGLAAADIYLDHLSPRFLFTQGGQPFRYQLPRHGLLYLFDLVLVLVGIGVVFGSKLKRNGWYMLGWLVISPIAASVTMVEVPSTIRSFFMVVPLIFFVGNGLWWMWNKKTLVSRVIFGGVILVYVWSFGYFVNQYMVQFPHFYSQYRGVAEEKMAEMVTGIADNYEAVVLTRRTAQGYNYLALAGAIEPQILQESYPTRTMNEYSLGKFSFVDEDCPLGENISTLYVVKDVCVWPVDAGADQAIDLVADNRGNTYRKIGEALPVNGIEGYVLLEWVAKPISK